MPFDVLGSYADEYAVYGYKNIDMVVWISSATGSGVRSYAQLFRRRIQQHGMLSAVHVALPSAGMPDAEGRTEFDNLAERYSKQCACIVTVIERDGFVGSALRAFTTGIYALTSRHTSHRVFRNVTEAAAWIPEPHTRRTGVPIDPRELEVVFLAMRSQHA